MPDPIKPHQEEELTQEQVQMMVQAVNDMTANIPVSLCIFCMLLWKMISFNNLGKAKPERMAHFSVSMPAVDNKPAWVWVTFDPEVAGKMNALVKEKIEKSQIIMPEGFRL